MLANRILFQTQTVDQLTKIWSNRYVPELSKLVIGGDLAIRDKLRIAASQQGRIHTSNKLDKCLIETQCSLAAVRARDLYAYYDVSSFKETANLAKFISRIYLRLTEIYKESAPVSIEPQAIVEEPLEVLLSETWGISNIDKLIIDLSPLLSELKRRHRVAKTWQSVGFITTQISLSNALLLEQLAPTEQVLINCYFKFLEEQVALPWQRVCAAAAEHHPASIVFKTVAEMLPLTTEISTTVYEGWSKSFPTYNSRRGSIHDPGIKHSAIRDFDMFQVYLWLYFLEGSPTLLEQELSDLYAVVFNALNIPWQMIVEGVFLLINEVINRLGPYQQKLIEPYIKSMIRTFSSDTMMSTKAKELLGAEIQ